MNILFVCSRNIWRSPTAEAIYKNRQDLNVRSAGTEPSARIKVTAKSISWADIILVILDIEDDYQFMDNELIDMIRVSVDQYL